ncbi:MAG: RtcB family protein [Myxococcota bacterium]
MSAELHSWASEPLSDAVLRSLQRLRDLDGAVQVAVMPDIHLAREVCVGVVLATERWIYPAAIGGDIGCGVSAIPFDVPASRVTADLLAPIQRLVPIRTRPAAVSVTLPQSLQDQPLSADVLEKHKRREGTLEFGTVGRGNHFLELSEDETGRLWALVHSGSRAMGPAIQHHHRARSTHQSRGLEAVVADSPEGRAYLSDLAWARRYASESRHLILSAVIAILGQRLAATPQMEALIDCDHNHVRQERHGARWLWVHRKGALEAKEGQPAVIPGSMQAPTLRVVGRGCVLALRSSSHGAGRRLSRAAARRRISPQALQKQLGAVMIDRRKIVHLVDEAPSAYKDITAVMRAQRALTRTQGVLRPVLNHKGI